MAWAVLKGLGAPALVSRADIDGASHKVVSAEGCRITQLKSEGGVLSFDRLDDALPMPIDTRAEQALQLAPILSEIDQYELRVSGLPGANYEVNIDGESAGKISAGDLARGWNMANAPGPITKQAREVLRLVFEKNNLFFHRWREIQLFGFPSWAQGPEAENLRSKAIAQADQQIAEREAEIEKVRTPKSHHFELKPVGQ
jgi:hypothetical protein